jgi:uncharacterized protein
MKHFLSLAMVLGVSFLTVPAHAIECRKASSAIELMICSDPRLRSTDTDMGKTYDDALQSTDDAEIRTMLITGQKRWLASRDKRLGRFGADDEVSDRAAQRRVLLEAMQDRTNVLAQRSPADPKLLLLVAVALEQRRFNAQFTGGLFAGIDTSCDFFPTSGVLSYRCFAAQHYQNDTRLCTVEQYWATYRVYEKHDVADVVNGRAKMIATCSLGAGSGAAQCPDADDQTNPGHWNFHPDPPADSEAPPHSLPNLDAEIGEDIDSSWLSACLTNKDYPTGANSQ